MNQLALNLNNAVKVSPWADERAAERLKSLWHNHSCASIAAILSLEFGVLITRSAVIGKAHRMGLKGQSKTLTHNMRGPRKPRQPKAPKQHRPTLRIIAANGNSDKLKVVRSIATSLPQLRCIEEPPLNLTLAELRDDQCHYIAGDDHLYCGRPGYYCLSHAQLMHIAPVQKVRTFYSYSGLRR